MAEKLIYSFGRLHSFSYGNTNKWWQWRDTCLVFSWRRKTKSWKKFFFSRIKNIVWKKKFFFFKHYTCLVRVFPLIALALATVTAALAITNLWGVGLPAGGVVHFPCLDGRVLPALAPAAQVPIVTRAHSAHVGAMAVTLGGRWLETLRKHNISSN